MLSSPETGRGLFTSMEGSFLGFFAEASFSARAFAKAFSVISTFASSLSLRFFGFGLDGF